VVFHHSRRERLKKKIKNREINFNKIKQYYK